MNYIVKITTGGQFEINSEEAEAIALTKDDGSITLKRLGIVIQKRMIQVFPKDIVESLEDKKLQKIGILHDGSKTRRHFGEWVDYNSAPDDNGNYSPVRINPEYYPEVAYDCVPTPEEFEKIKHLSLTERLKHILNKKETQRSKIQETKSIKEVINGYPIKKTDTHQPYLNFK